MSIIGKRIGVPIDKFTGNRQFLVGIAAALLGAAAAVHQIV